MNVTEVDERDSHWEDDDPIFRVFFQTEHEPPNYSAATEVHELRGGDFIQALQWARVNVPQGSTFSIAVVIDLPGQRNYGIGMIWLVGCDANDIGTDAEHNWAVYQKMLRRSQPEWSPLTEA